MGKMCTLGWADLECLFNVAERSTSTMDMISLKKKAALFEKQSSSTTTPNMPSLTQTVISVQGEEPQNQVF